MESLTKYTYEFWVQSTALELYQIELDVLSWDEPDAEEVAKKHCEQYDGFVDKSSLKLMYKTELSSIPCVINERWT